jgi:hypothetical protein
MPLPNEYNLSDAVRSADDMIVYRAEHPIHGTVDVYLPDENLPFTLAAAARNRLYQYGLQLRNISLLNLPFVTKSLEVSQNPTEPYVVTKEAKHDLEELISNGVILKPKRIFTILSQALEAMIGLAANGCVPGKVRPRQIKLSDLHTGRITFNLLEGSQSQTDINQTISAPVQGKDIATKPVPPKGLEKTPPPVSATDVTVPIDRAPAPPKTVTGISPKTDIDRTITADLGDEAEPARKQLRIIQRNIYILANAAYELLFGRKYEPAEQASAVNIKNLGRRWRKVLQKALTNNTIGRYNNYEELLRDINRSLNRNKRLAVASIPLLLIIVVIASYFGYERYRRHKIMTSEAGQAIKTFLDIVNKASEDVEKVQIPEPPPDVPDDKTILQPFEKIEPVKTD